MLLQQRWLLLDGKTGEKGEEKKKKQMWEGGGVKEKRWQWKLMMLSVLDRQAGFLSNRWPCKQTHAWQKLASLNKLLQTPPLLGRFIYLFIYFQLYIFVQPQKKIVWNTEPGQITSSFIHSVTIYYILYEFLVHSSEIVSPSNFRRVIFVVVVSHDLKKNK